MDAHPSHERIERGEPGPPGLPPVPDSKPLSALSEGASAVVLDVEAGPPGGRCMELGLIPGAFVEVLRGGDPMLLRIGGARVGISQECLSHIMVVSVRG